MRFGASLDEGHRVAGGEGGHQASSAGGMGSEREENGDEGLTGEWQRLPQFGGDDDDGQHLLQFEKKGQSLSKDDVSSLAAHMGLAGIGASLPYLLLFFPFLRLGD